MTQIIEKFFIKQVKMFANTLYYITTFNTSFMTENSLATYTLIFSKIY